MTSKPMASSIGPGKTWAIGLAARSRRKGSSGGATDGPHRGVDPDRFHGHHRLRRYHDGPAKITTPTLVITTEQSGLGSVAETRAWQQQIPGSQLVVLEGNSYHVAATHADQAAAATLNFLRRRGGGP